MGFSFGGFSTSGIADSITGSVKDQVSGMFDGFLNGSETVVTKSYSLCCGYRDTKYSNKDFGFNTADMFNGLGKNINDLLNTKFDMDSSQYDAWMSQMESMMERLKLIQSCLPLITQIVAVLKGGVSSPDKSVPCRQAHTLASNALVS